MKEVDKNGKEEKESKQVGCYNYTECPICGDLSWVDLSTKITPHPNAPKEAQEQYVARGFCINQHKDSEGNERQPASLGTNMVGKPFSQTPIGKKQK